MNNNIFRMFRYLLLIALSLTLSADAARPRQSTVRLSDHVPNKAVANAVYVKNLEATATVPLTFILPLRNQNELDELIARMYDPNDKEHYKKYLTTNEFIERFAPKQEDYDKVVAYAKSLGLTVSNTHPNRLLVNVSGNTRAVERAFNLRLRQYQLPNGRNFHAPSDNPQVPASIASTISGIVGLDNHSVWRPFYRFKTETFESANAAGAAVPSGPAGGYSPNDIKVAYNLTDIQQDGSGQAVALFELASYLTSDITGYTKQFGLPAPQLKNVMVDGGSGAQPDAEVTLDIQLVLALAPKATVYVYEGPNSNQGVLDTYNKIATDNLAKQVSTSWGLGEDNVAKQQLDAENAIFKQMAAQGQTIYAAAGDSGAYDDYSNNNSTALVVDDPASQPYVTGVGGTKLTVDPQSGAYGSEAVWNNGAGNEAGGGGVSTIWPIPSWQSNVTTVYSTTFRNVPDVCLNADPNTGYAIYFNGQWQPVGGTSCAAPLWAAFTALVNENQVANNKPVLGYANPVIYGVGTGGSYGSDFHDIVTGDNLNYNAQPGYDNATGWGSFNAANLFGSLTGSSPAPAPTPVPTPGPSPAPTPGPSPAPTPGPAPSPTPGASPNLSIDMKHYAPFTKGEIGVYNITVANNGSGSTSGTVNVAVNLPDGLIFYGYNADGWDFDPDSNTFSQNSTLESQQEYPVISVYVQVDNDAPHKVVPSATVSGGGSNSATVTDLTTCR